MAGRQGIQSSWVKVGVLMLVALSAVAAVFFLISGKTSGLLSRKITVRAYYKNAAGLKVGSPVNLDGITIGNVRAIRIVAQPSLTPVEVIMKIRKKYRGYLLTDSQANINTIGVLGSTEVDIDNVRAQGQPIANNGVLLTGGVPNLQAAIKSFQNATQKFNTTLSQMNVLASQFGSDKGSIGKLINDPALRNQAAAAVNEFSSIPAQVNSGKGTVGKFMKKDSLTNHLKDTQAKFATIGTDITSGQGTAGKFIKDPALKKNLKGASRQLHEISTEVQSGQGAVGMMLKDQDFKKTLQETKEQLRSIKAQTSSGKGTIGQMMNNPSLGNELKELVSNSRALVAGIRKHPFKYVRIRLRLF